MADTKLTALTELNALLDLDDPLYVVDDPAGTATSKKVLARRLMLDQAFIRGLVVTKNSGGNTLDISAGYCFDPATNKVIYYAGGTGISAGTLGASQWNQVYLSESGGTSTITVTNNTDPPSTAYFGTARKDGSNRRWIGSFLTTAASAIYTTRTVESGGNGLFVSYLAATNSAPFRLLSAGTSTSYSALSISATAGPVPRYATAEIQLSLTSAYTGTAGADCVMGLSIDGTNLSVNNRAYVFSTSVGFPNSVVWAPLDADTPQLYYRMTAVSPGVSPAGYIDVVGYKVTR